MFVNRTITVIRPFTLQTLSVSFMIWCQCIDGGKEIRDEKITTLQQVTIKSYRVHLARVVIEATITIKLDICRIFLL